MDTTGAKNVGWMYAGNARPKIYTPEISTLKSQQKLPWLINAKRESNLNVL